MQTIQNFNRVIIVVGIAFILSGCAVTPKNMTQATVLPNERVEDSLRTKTVIGLIPKTEEAAAVVLRGEASPWSFESFAAGAFVGKDLLVLV